jgi:hypothetical protein
MDVGDSLPNVVVLRASSVFLEDFRPNEVLKRGESCLGVQLSRKESPKIKKKQELIPIQGDLQKVSDLWMGRPFKFPSLARTISTPDL